MDLNSLESSFYYRWKKYKWNQTEVKMESFACLVNTLLSILCKISTWITPLIIKILKAQSLLNSWFSTCGRFVTFTSFSRSIDRYNQISKILFFFFFADSRFCWHQQVVTWLFPKIPALIVFIFGTLRLHFKQKFTCNTNVHTGYYILTC